jgi:DegV family protein with EDD domain
MAENKIHIITDAAGSLTFDDSEKYKFTLLQSVVNFADKSVHEREIDPVDVYTEMVKGTKASTAQSSLGERQESYSEALKNFDRVLYLCVGSIYTGNYTSAVEWKKNNDKDNRFTVLDTGYASGRLAVVALKTAQFALEGNVADKVIDYSKSVISKAEEFIFLEKLQYLAAGGRLSKTSAFFGDAMKMKPVISPCPDGATKAGVVRTHADQVKFAIRRLSMSIPEGSSPYIMLEYTNNKDRVENEISGKIKELYPKAEIFLQPLSLTTGVHVGPGSWGVAFLPEKI